MFGKQEVRIISLPSQRARVAKTVMATNAIKSSSTKKILTVSVASLNEVVDYVKTDLMPEFDYGNSIAVRPNGKPKIATAKILTKNTTKSKPDRR